MNTKRRARVNNIKDLLKTEVMEKIIVMNIGENQKVQWERKGIEMQTLKNIWEKQEVLK